MHKLRITQAGMQNFTGHFGVEFVDGVSIDPVDRNRADHISALVQVEVIDDVGEGIGQAGVAARLVGGATIALEATQLATATDAELEEERKREKLAFQPPKLYTADELQVIADEGGIAAIRVIAEPWNVKDRAISNLMREILKAQDAYKKAQDEKAVKAAEATKEAEAAALAEQAAKAAEFDAAARDVSHVN